MKMPWPMSLLSFPPGRRPLWVGGQGLTVWSLLAQLWPGEGAPSLFPPAQSFGGPGAPPTTAGEVAQTFRQPC
jgi:hypothetical protein